MRFYVLQNTVFKGKYSALVNGEIPSRREKNRYLMGETVEMMVHVQ